MRSTTKIFILTLSMAVGSCSKTDPKPTPTPTSTTTSSTSSNASSGGNSTPTAPTVTAPDTYFLSNACGSLGSLGSWWAQDFTLSGSTSLVLRFSSRYKADAAILASGQVSNFKNNLGFTGYGVFDDLMGYKFLTLPAGSYTLAVRNQVSSANTYTIELDYYLSFPLTDKLSFYDTYVETVQVLNPGAYFYQGFSIQAGFRYFVDGNNTGVSTYLMPDSEISKFKAGTTFTFYTDYSSSTGECGYPGLYEIKLPVGNYYLAFRNEQTIVNTVNYEMERWKVN